MLVPFFHPLVNAGGPGISTLRIAGPLLSKDKLRKLNFPLAEGLETDYFRAILGQLGH